MTWQEWSSNLTWHLDLGVENNVAAWWSGALLAACAFFASDGYARFRHDDRPAARAWLAIAAILLFLSADEIGSLHERLSLLGKALNLGSWALLLPLGALLGSAYVWSAIVLSRRGDAERRRVLVLSLGFGLLASVALQEFIEHAVAWESPAAKALRRVVEEGTELAGMLVLLRVTSGNSFASEERLPFQSFFDALKPLGMIVLFAAPLLVAVTLWLPDHGMRGRPSDWLAAVMFLGAGALAARHAVFSRENVTGAFALVLLCGMASVVSVAVEPQKTMETGLFDLGARAMTLGLVVMAMGAILTLFTSVHWQEAVLLHGMVLIYLIVPASLFSGHVFPLILGGIACIGAARPTREERLACAAPDAVVR
ncbi:hypothetical protein [uncultured Jannaschia sp.]|uniref:hypothetical protein n=1 Tax=uncultured Jannaschia sp. TaxID=293347 RepID=UPI002626A594|nr:hypothetical protein [uncultured Jannaschia sp.]